MPVKFSLVTPFNLSVIFWTTLNLGDTTYIIENIVTKTITTPTPVANDHSHDLPKIFTTAHKAVIGDLIIKIVPIANNICNWVISFVVLVIKEEVLNFFISAKLNSSTLSNNFFLVFFENDAAILAVNQPVTTRIIKLPKAHNNMNNPLSNISFILLPGVWDNLVTCDI